MVTADRWVREHYSQIHWPEAITLSSILLAVVLFIVGIGAPNPNPQPSPRLVGYECEGAQGPLYADEEDDFPRCKEIERR